MPASVGAVLLASSGLVPQGAPVGRNSRGIVTWTSNRRLQRASRLLRDASSHTSTRASGTAHGGRSDAVAAGGEGGGARVDHPPCLGCQVPGRWTLGTAAERAARGGDQGRPPACGDSGGLPGNRCVHGGRTALGPRSLIGRRGRVLRTWPLGGPRSGCRPLHLRLRDPRACAPTLPTSCAGRRLRRPCTHPDLRFCIWTVLRLTRPHQVLTAHRRPRTPG